MSDIATETITAFPEITLHDRCDSCLQHAVAIVEIASDLPHLYACGHHFRKHRSIFIERGYSYKADPKHDVQFTNAFRDKELAEAGVSGKSGT